MTDDQGGLKTNFSFLNIINPLSSPKWLEGDQGVADFVVSLHLLLVILVFDECLRELLHWRAAAEEQVAGPCDGTWNSGQIAHNRWVPLLLSVLLFNHADFRGVLLEEKLVFGLQILLEIFTVKNSLELSQQLQRILNAGDIFKVLIDVCLQLSLYRTYISFEFDEVSVEDVVDEVKKFVRFLLKLIDKGLKW